MTLRYSNAHLTFALVADFLRANKYTDALASLRQEAPEYFPDASSTATVYDAAMQDAFRSPHSHPSSAGLLMDMVAQWQEDRLREQLAQSRLHAHHDDALLTLTSAFGDRLATMQRFSTISHLHDKNIIALTSWPCMQTEGMSWLLTSSADRTLKLVDLVHGIVMATLFDASLTENQGLSGLPHRSPILVVSVHPHDPMVILTASMDGSHALSRLHLNADGSAGLECLQTWQDHRKYIVRAQFSPDGHWMATASYDKTLRVYVDVGYAQQQVGMVLPPGPATDRYRLVFSQAYPGTVEGMCFVNEPLAVVISVRDDNYLHYYHLPTFEEQKYNMNASGDDVVSFTAMHLLPSPCAIHGQRYLLVATDQENGRSILFGAHSDRQVRQFYGVQIDGYSQPRHCWMPDASHFYATSDADHAVWVFRISDGKCIRKLGGVDADAEYSGQGHRGIVRDLVFDASTGTLITASYDQTVALWR